MKAPLFNRLLTQFKEEVDFLETILSCAEVRDAMEEFYGKEFLKASDEALITNQALIKECEERTTGVNHETRTNTASRSRARSKRAPRDAKNVSRD